MHKSMREVVQYTHNQFLADTFRIGELLQNEIEGWKPDIIFAVARGGLTFAAYLAHKLNVKRVMDVDTYLNSDNKKMFPKSGRVFNALLVDDISDSGETLDFMAKALAAKLAEETFDNPEAGNPFKILTTTLWIRSNTKFMPDYFARVVEGNAWIAFPWEAELERAKVGFCVEILKHNHQSYDPPSLLGMHFKYDTEEKIECIESLQVVNEAEYATVFDNPHAAYACLHELHSRSAEFKEVFNLGVPVVAEHVYNKDKHDHYWNSVK